MTGDPNDTRLPGLLASLQLDSYVVDDLIFKNNSPILSDQSNTATPTISIDFDVKHHKKEPSRYLISMEVDLNKGQELKEFRKYQLHLHIYGWFRFTEEADELTREKMIHTNGASMLYGIARGVVAQLTGTLGPSRYILPTLNLMKVIEEKTKRAEKSTAVTG